MCVHVCCVVRHVWQVEARASDPVVVAPTQIKRAVMGVAVVPEAKAAPAPVHYEPEPGMYVRCDCGLSEGVSRRIHVPLCLV